MFEWFTIDLDYIFYAIHLLLSKIWHVISFGWLRDSGAARAVEETNRLGNSVGSDAGFFDRWFGSALYRFGYSQPSAERDSVAELLNPTDEKGIGRVLFDLIFGPGDKESIFSLIFGSFIGWIVLLTLLLWFLRKWFQDQAAFHTERHKLQYAVNHTRDVVEDSNYKTKRWQDIVEKVGTGNSDLMKIGILDADILLDEVLQEQGYAGETVADKLKDAQRDNLTTLQYAWEAHKLRNLIAHDSSYTLTERDAKRGIDNFEKFFGELYHL